MVNNKEEFIIYLESIGFEKKPIEKGDNQYGINIDFIHVYKFLEVGVYELRPNNILLNTEVLIYYSDIDKIWLSLPDAVTFINDKLKYEFRKKKLSKILRNV
jgi:hypothetical protein